MNINIDKFSIYDVDIDTLTVRGQGHAAYKIRDIILTDKYNKNNNN